MKTLLLIIAVNFLFACQSSSIYSGQSNAFIKERYTNEPEIALGSNLKSALNRLRGTAIPKLQMLDLKRNVTIFVSGYSNNVNSNLDTLPIGGARGNPVPSHNAFQVFSGSGFKVVPKSCTKKNVGDGLNLHITTSIVAFDERVNFQRNGFEVTGDGSSSTGVYDTSNWFSQDNLVLMTQLSHCNNGEIIHSEYLPLSLVSKNQADSFLFFNKAFGLYYTDSESMTVSPQLKRDNASLFGMMKIAAKMSILSKSEYELAFYGFTASYNEQAGILNTRYSDASFDPSQARFLITSEYFGQIKAETVDVPFGPHIELKLRQGKLAPSLQSGVRHMVVKLEYQNEIVFRKLII